MATPGSAVNPSTSSGSGASSTASNPYASGAGGAINWNSDMSNSALYSAVFPVLDSNADDPFGLAGILPAVGKGHAPQSIGSRIASVAKIPLAKQEALAQVLVAAGLMSQKANYTTTEVQDALATAFRHAGQSGAGSLSRYLNESISQRQAAGQTTSVGGVHVIAAPKVEQTTYTAADIQATADAVGQKLIGRKLNEAEMQGVLAEMNGASAAKASADVSAVEAQQQSDISTSNAVYNPGSNTSAAGANVPNTTGNFAQDLLSGLGLPTTAANVNAINAWHQAEGGNAAYNPLNTTQGAAGASNYNKVGVKNYTSYQQGLQATIQTLKNGHYGGILNALKAGNNALSVASAVGASPWGTSGALMAKVLGGKVAPISGTAQGGSQGQTTDVYQQPVVADVPAPPSQEEAATNYLETQRAPEYQANNLLDVFQMIQSKLASPDPSLNAHVRQTPVSMKA